jgi:hypothetical protein
MNCPECGAPDQKCEGRYHECLVKEFSEAGYGSVHHLTVCAYMVQHSSKLTKEGWLFERNLLREFLVENKDPALIGKENREQLDSGKRDFKIVSKNGNPKIAHTTWEKTILDVRLGEAEQYCQDITAWAKAVLQEAENCDVL